MQATQLTQQIDFIMEIDRLKQVYRQTYLTDGSRKENDAEHSWHLAVMAILLLEYAPGNPDLLRVVKMVLIHDLVEIDAGDTFCYDDDAHCDKEKREKAAAKRIFALLPQQQSEELHRLWDEFEEGKTPEARFAAALDRLHPLLHNYHTRGKSWQEHGVTQDKVLSRNSSIKEGAPALWDYARQLITKAVEEGFLDGEKNEQAKGYKT